MAEPAGFFVGVYRSELGTNGEHIDFPGSIRIRLQRDGSANRDDLVLARPDKRREAVAMPEEQYQDLGVAGSRSARP